MLYIQMADFNPSTFGDAFNNVGSGGPGPNNGVNGATTGGLPDLDSTNLDNLELGGGGESSQNPSGNPSSVDISNILGNLTGDAPTGASSGSTPFQPGPDSNVPSAALPEVVPESTTGVPTGSEGPPEQTESGLEEGGEGSGGGAETGSAVATTTEGTVEPEALAPEATQEAQSTTPTVAQAPSLENTTELAEVKPPQE